MCEYGWKLVVYFLQPVFDSYFGLKFSGWRMSVCKFRKLFDTIVQCNSDANFDLRPTILIAANTAENDMFILLYHLCLMWNDFPDTWPLTFNLFFFIKKKKKKKSKYNHHIFECIRDFAITLKWFSLGLLATTHLSCIFFVFTHDEQVSAFSHPLFLLCNEK